MQGRLRAIRLPLLLHFEDDDESLARGLKCIGEIYQEIRNLLGAPTFNQPQYEAKQDEFHKVYAELYADLALRIERGKKAQAAEVKQAANIVMAK